MWTKARLTIYLTTAFAGVASLLALVGAASFDRATWVLDINPVDVRWLAGFIAGPMASTVATVAVWFKWGKP